MLTTILKIILVLIISTTNNVVWARDFYGRNKNGWYYYEEHPVQEQRKITEEEAEILLKQFKRELKLARYLMVIEPTDENILNYRKKEEVMWEKAMKLGVSWGRLNFLHPELFDRSKDPINVHAVKLKRKIEAQELNQSSNKLAEKYDLVLFRKSGCRYCEAFEPVLADFAKQHGFKVEAINTDDSVSQYFASQKVSGLAEKIGINSLPAVIMVKKGGSHAQEFSRGFLTIEELEEISNQAYKYLKERNLL